MSGDGSYAATRGSCSDTSSSDVNSEICSLLKKMKTVVCMKVGRVDAEAYIAAGGGAVVPGAQLEVHLLQENWQECRKKPVRC